MEDVSKQARGLDAEVDAAAKRLDINAAESELTGLKNRAQAPDFWKDNVAAQDNLKNQSKLEAKIRPWRNLQVELKDIIELSATHDNSLLSDLSKQLSQAQVH